MPVSPESSGDHPMVRGDTQSPSTLPDPQRTHTGEFNREDRVKSATTAISSTSQVSAVTGCIGTSNMADDNRRSAELDCAYRDSAVLAVDPMVERVFSHYQGIRP